MNKFNVTNIREHLCRHYKDPKITNTQKKNRSKRVKSKNVVKFKINEL